MDFNQRALDKLTTPGNFWDPSTPGLVLRINGKSKSWSFVYRVGGRAAKKKWLKIGDFKDLPLNRAQVQVRAYRVQVEAGIDPGAAIKAAESIGMTIEKLAEKFQAEYLPKKSLSTQTGYAGLIRNYILPGLGQVEVAKLTRDQVTTWHGSINYQNAANRALACLSSMMTRAIDIYKVRETVNPCLKVERNPEEPRMRDITKAELAAIGKACKDLQGTHSLFALAAVRMVILTAGRVSEVIALRRDGDVHLEEGYALIRDHKGRKASGAKRMELAPAAIKLLQTLPEEAGNPYYFPGQKKGEGFTRSGLHKTWMAVCESAKVKDLHLHDSRSLAASEAEEQGLNPKTGAAILGHKDVRTTNKHYTRVRSAKTRSGAEAVFGPIAEALGE